MLSIRNRIEFQNIYPDLKQLDQLQKELHNRWQAELLPLKSGRKKYEDGALLNTYWPFDIEVNSAVYDSLKSYFLCSEPCEVRILVGDGERRATALLHHLDKQLKDYLDRLVVWSSGRLPHDDDDALSLVRHTTKKLINLLPVDLRESQKSGSERFNSLKFDTVDCFEAAVTLLRDISEAVPNKLLCFVGNFKTHHFEKDEKAVMSDRLRRFSDAFLLKSLNLQTNGKPLPLRKLSFIERSYREDLYCKERLFRDCAITADGALFKDEIRRGLRKLTKEINYDAVFGSDSCDSKESVA